MKQFTLMIIVLLSTSWMGGCTSTKTSDGASYGPAAFSQPAFTAVTVAYAPEMQGILNRIEQDPNASIHTTTTISQSQIVMTSNEQKRKRTCKRSLQTHRFYA